MSRLSVFTSRLRALFHPNRLERGLEAEVRFHLQMQIEDHLRSGMSASEARSRALRRFGGIEPMKEQYRDRSAFRAIETTTQDLRYAARSLRRSPAYTFTSIAILALAIGGNTAMFSVLNAVLLRPLPYPSPQQLAMLWSETPTLNLREGRTAYWNIEEWRRQSQSFSDIAAFDPASAILNGSRAERISVAHVTPNFLPLLGIQPFAGRNFTVTEATQRQRLALISYKFWQSRFGSSLTAIGSTLDLDGQPSEIIGILPPNFQFPKLDPDVWEPHTVFPDWETRRRARGAGSWLVLARLHPNISFDQAQAEMSAIAQRIGDHGIRVVPLTLQLIGPTARLALWLLAGAILCVLLIAASNVAGLCLARSASRVREIQIRASLGASRFRIVRQLLTESLLVAVAAGVGGLLIAILAIRGVISAAPLNLPRLGEAALDPRALAVAAALSLITGSLLGLAPALHLSRPNPRSSSRSAATRRALVMTQFAVAVLLLTGTGLLLRSLWFVQNVNLGFRSSRILSLQVAVPGNPASFARRVLEEVEPLPGIESAGWIGDLFVGSTAEHTVILEGTSLRLPLRRDEISENLFRTIGVSILKGRYFSPADTSDSPRVAIVNDPMARTLWPDRDPIGRRFQLDVAGPWYTVVGVAAAMRRQGLENDPTPQMFEPLAQNPSRLMTLLVRTSGDDPLALLPAVRAAVHGIDKHAPVYGETTLDNRLDQFLEQRRFQSRLLIAFSGIALLIASIGVYGLVQYAMATRKREIAIRIAVGAQANEIFRLIIGEGLKLSLIGGALGLIGALALRRFVSGLLFSVTPTDPLTFAAVALLLVCVATAACVLPAHRATRIDPLPALRHD